MRTASSTSSATWNSSNWTLVDNDADNAELRGYIERHYKHTGSPLAGRMLQDWQRYVREFIKVTPIEYKKILASVNNVAE